MDWGLPSLKQTTSHHSQNFIKQIRISDIGKCQHHPSIMHCQIQNLGTLKLIYAHHYYRKEETPRFLRNPSSYLSNHEDRKTHQNPAHLGLRLVCKKATVVKVEHNFVWTEGPSSVPKNKGSNTQYFPKLLQDTNANPKTTNKLK